MAQQSRITRPMPLSFWFKEGWRAHFWAPPTRPRARVAYVAGFFLPHAIFLGTGFLIAVGVSACGPVQCLWMSCPAQ